ncbi:hypothetical protein L916_01300 [Phytophthora nicotianae]|uniref:Uncharacterized protein n=1 Tax=Phytophthora nicotianae TaxID=4792 RepID=W2JS09_PHYNI|nr:hypothetical protein L916_01300 [Phytophthora nicotianae]
MLWVSINNSVPLHKAGARTPKHVSDTARRTKRSNSATSISNLVGSGYFTTQKTTANGSTTSSTVIQDMSMETAAAATASRSSTHLSKNGVAVEETFP